MASFKKVLAKKFWAWFLDNEATVLATDDPESEILTEFTDRLRSVHDGLVWEITPVGTSPREIVISADGLAENVEAVDMVCDAAPTMQGWRIVRFRPRVDEEIYRGMRVKVGRITVDARETEVALYPLEDGVIAIDVFSKACKKDDDPDVMNVMFIMLDAALGEFDMLTKVGPVFLHPFKSKPEDGFERIPFTRLRPEFDQLFEELHPG